MPQHTRWPHLEVPAACSAPAALEPGRPVCISRPWVQALCVVFPHSLDLPSSPQPSVPGDHHSPVLATTWHSRLLEAAHAVQDVELLPALGEVHLAIHVVRVAKVDEGQVLQDQTPGREMEKSVT